MWKVTGCKNCQCLMKCMKSASVLKLAIELVINSNVASSADEGLLYKTFTANYTFYKLQQVYSRLIHLAMHQGLYFISCIIFLFSEILVYKILASECFGQIWMLNFDPFQWFRPESVQFIDPNQILFQVSREPESFGQKSFLRCINPVFLRLYERDIYLWKTCLKLQECRCR